jgi:hypothetical protein
VNPRDHYRTLLWLTAGCATAAVAVESPCKLTPVAAHSGYRSQDPAIDARGSLFVNELDDDAADELGDGAAQLVSDERLKRLRRRGHAPEFTTQDYNPHCGRGRRT